MSRLTQGGSASGGGSGGAVDSVDGRTGSVTLEDLYVPTDTVPESGTGALGLTGLDGLIHSLTTLTAANVDGGSTLTIPATVKTSSVTLGQFGRVQWVNPSPPISSQRLVGARVTVTCGAMVNAVQVVGVGNTDGTPTPNNQRVVSSTASGGFAGEGDFCYRFGSAGGCTQVLEFAILSDAAAGDLGVVVASGGIAPGATVPDITITSIDWLYADPAVEARVNAVSQAFAVDYNFFGNVDLSTVGATIAAVDHPPTDGSQFLLNNQTDASQKGIYTYAAGVLTRNAVQPSTGIMFISQGMDATFTDFAQYVGFLERYIVSRYEAGTLSDQYLPNAKQTALVYGPGTFSLTDSVMIRRHRPTADGDSITTIGTLDGTEGIVAGRQYTFVNESEDPSYRTILDCSDNNVSGQSEIIVPYRGGVVIYADDIAGEWVLIGRWGDLPVPPDSGTQTLQSVDGVIQWA